MIDKIIKTPIKFYGYVKKDFLLLVKRKKYLYLSIAIPAVVALIFLFMLNPSKAGIKFEVCDYDNTDYSRDYLSNLEGFKAQFLPLDNCEARLISDIKLGKTPFGIEIPGGFSESLDNLQPAMMIIHYDNTDIAFSNLISWKVDVSLNKYKKQIVDVFNQEIKRKVTSLRSNVDVALALSSSSNVISKRIRLIDSDLKRIEETPTDFLVNPIETEKRPVYQENLSKDAGISFIFPIISMFIILMLSSTSLIYDKKTNFITRVKSSTSPSIYLLAKLVFFFAITIAQFLIILLLFLIYGSTYQAPILGVLKVILMIAMMNTLVGLIIGLVSENEGIAILFSLMLSFPMMLLSGVFFAIQTMPGFLQYLTKLSPIFYQITAMKAVMLFNQAISNNWVYPLVALFLLVNYLINRI